MDDLPQDPAMQAEIVAQGVALTSFLPPDLRDLQGDDEASKAELCRDLLREGSVRLLARLTVGAS